MVINIPIQIDEAKMEEVIQRDYEQRVIKLIAEHITTALTKQSTSYYVYDKASDGMTNLIYERIDLFIGAHKDEIIEIAGSRLAERLARTKAAKSLIKDLEADNNLEGE